MIFVAADWGTTHLRAYLASSNNDGTVSLLDECRGPGITEVTDRQFDAALAQAVQPWLSQTQSVFVSGMAGSTLGWVDVPYAGCPADTKALAANIVRMPFAATTAHVIGGVQGKNPLGINDVMRGEELQTFGAMASAGSDFVAVLPGTHNKWVRVCDGRIQSFFTALTGETYALLGRHSVLVPDIDQHDHPAVFAEGVSLALTHGAEQLLTLLFSVRARQLSGELQAEHSGAYLSGLMIGADVDSGLRLARSAGWALDNVLIVAEPKLCALYTSTLAAHGVNAQTVDGAQAALSGYAQLLSATGAR